MRSTSIGDIDLLLHTIGRMPRQKSIKPFIPAMVFILFPLSVLGITVYLQYPWFVQIFAAERGAGTWLSSMLLCCGATVALLVGTMSRRKFLWPTFACVLLILSADDKFMIHEFLKHSILYYFYQNDSQRMGFAGDVPVMVAGIAGFFLALRFFLISRLPHIRFLIGCMVVCGGLSVAFDVLYIDAVFEEILKLSSEMFCLVWLLEEFRYHIINPATSDS